MKHKRWWLAGLLATCAIAVAGTVRAEDADDGFAPSPEAICPALVGAQVPEVSLRSMDGASVNLREKIAQAPTAVIFYRGGW